jgi:hypothetical protein
MNKTPTRTSHLTISAHDPNPRFEAYGPTSSTGLDRQVFLRVAGRIELTGYVNAEQIAFRDFPLQSCMTSTGLTINDQVLDQRHFNRILPSLVAHSATRQQVSIISDIEYTPDSTVITFDIVEPLMFWPFFDINEDKEVIHGIEVMKFEPHFEWDRMVNIPSVITIDKQELQLSWVSSFSNKLNYYYPKIDCTTYKMTEPLTLSNVKSLPSHIFIAVTHADDQTFLPIESLTMRIGNDCCVFKGASPHQLYNVSLRGGLEMSYSQWASGGPMIIDVSKEFCMDAPFTFEIESIGFQSDNAEIQVITVTPGCISIGDGKCVLRE